jgi:hypothetical protein
MIRHSYKTFKTQGDGPDKGMGQKGSLVAQGMPVISIQFHYARFAEITCKTGAGILRMESAA